MNRWMVVRCLAFLWLTGCASVSVCEKQESKQRIPSGKPPIFYVMDFSTEGAELNVDREGRRLKRFRREMVRELSGRLVELFTRHLGITDRLAKEPVGLKKGWLIRGRFLRVNQGSRALRMGVGFGAGGTKMETEVSVYDLSISATKPFMRFCTSGGSNAEPGAAASVGTAVLTGGGSSVLGTGPGLVGRGAAGLTDDCQRTARMITATLSEYLAGRGWIPPGKELDPKEPFEKEFREATAGFPSTTNAVPRRATSR